MSTRSDSDVAIVTVVRRGRRRKSVPGTTPAYFYKWGEANKVGRWVGTWISPGKHEPFPVEMSFAVIIANKQTWCPFCFPSCICMYRYYYCSTQQFARLPPHVRNALRSSSLCTYNIQTVRYCDRSYDSCSYNNSLVHAYCTLWLMSYEIHRRSVFLISFFVCLTLSRRETPFF